MKNIRLIVAAALCACVIILTGCASYRASEVHRTIAFPGFSDEFHAVDVSKEVNEEGKTVYKAKTLTHGTTVLGVTRTANYKDAELKVEEDK